MNFEILSEVVEWEAKRVAAAFGVGAFYAEDAPTDSGMNSGGVVFHFKGLTGSVIVTWVLSGHCARLESVELGAFKSCYIVRRCDNTWRYQEDVVLSQSMARGLYRLGFEDEGVLSQLPPLSAHEQLELRLSLPREFWPKTWIDEETQTEL